MLYTKLTTGHEARKKLQKGINILTEAIGITLGAKGLLYALRRMGGQPTIVSKDGVKGAREVVLQDEELQAGVNLAQQAAIKTVQQAGDGTTATIILTNAIVNEGIKAIEAGENAVTVVEQIQKATAEVVEYIKKTAMPIHIEPVEGEMDYLKHVATIAANGDEYLGGIIADAYRKVGKEGLVMLGGQVSSTTEIRLSKGLRVPVGYLNDAFITNAQKRTAELDNPRIVIYENMVTDPNHILLPDKIIQEAIKDKRPVLFMCDGLDEVSKSSLMGARAVKGIAICVTTLPAKGDSQKELLKDIAAATGATIIGTKRGLKISEAKLIHCGEAKRVIVGKDYTVFETLGEHKDAIDKRADEIRGQITEAQKEAEYPFTATELQDRLAKLTAGIATIHVGGVTEVERLERLDRVEDAILAAKSAIEEGVVIGGGMCLMNCVYNGSNEKSIAKAFTEPFYQLIENAGITLADKLPSENFGGKLGYNVRTGRIEDLLKSGIVDSAKVVRCSVENSSSVACQLLLTQTLMVQVNDAVDLMQ